MVSLKRLAAVDLRRKLKKQTEKIVNQHVDVFVFKRKHRRKQPHPSPSLLHPYSSTADSFISSALPAENNNKNNTGKKTQTSDDHNDRKERRATKPKKPNAFAVLVDDDRNDTRTRRTSKPKNIDSAAGVFDDDHTDRRSRKAPNPKKRNSVAVHHRKVNHQLPVEIVPLPASMLEKIMRELKGRGIDEKIVFEKNIMASDITKSQSRLTMSRDYGDRVLTKSERASLATEAKPALLIDPNNNIWRLHFNFWPAVRRYALIEGWNAVVAANVMRPGLHRVQLWYFRGERDTLCFALNILER